MPKRKTIEEAREIISNLSNGSTELLSEQYINTKTPLKLRCGKCGAEFERDLEHIIRGRVWCNDCAHQIGSEKLTFDLEYVKNVISSHGCEYISGEYKNNRSLLKIRCRCGNIFQKSFLKFQDEQDRCPLCGKESLKESRRKYTQEQAIEEFSKYGITLIGDYVDLLTPVRCMCEHGHEFDAKLAYVKQYKIPCPTCRSIEYSSWNEDLTKAIRGRLYSWQKSIFQCYNNACPITGTTSNIDLHHLKSFNVILDEVAQQLKIDKTQNVDSYLFDDCFSDYYIFLSLIRKEHDLYLGIPISHDIHVKFHQEYGYGNNTPQQFDEFLQKHYFVKLSDIQDRFIQKGG